MKIFYLMALTCFLLATPQQAEAKKINVSGSLEDQNGGVWKYTGWIEFDICCPPKLTHWDIWLQDLTERNITLLVWPHRVGRVAGGL